MRIGRMLAALALVGALGACSFFDKDLGTAKTGPIYSPNGEPLSGGALGDPKCADAMQRWFARVDANHDGTIDFAEFMADARRQFAAMDLEHTGLLTPAVLAQYRAPFIAEQPRHDADSDEEQQRTEDEERRRRRHNGQSEPAIGLDRADPVMMADASLRNRVSLDDFVAYARRNFASLDSDKDGRLSSSEVTALCKPE